MKIISLNSITKKLPRLIGALALTCSLVAPQLNATPRVASVRDVKFSEIDASKVVVPESFETDVHKMMTNWYIRKYAILDEKADSKPTVEATDDDYIERLSKIEGVIELPYNNVVKSFIKMYVERKKGLVEWMLGMSLYYMPIFEDALGKYDMPFELKYLPVIESALNPNAISRAGAAGLWQFMPGTATDEGLEVNSLVDERRDPYRSSDAAARYLKKLYGTFGNWSLAIAAYNCGPGNVSKAIKRAGGGSKDFWEIYPYLPSETRDYIPAFIAACYAMENFGKHGISPALAREPICIDTVHVTRRIHFQQISDVLNIPMEELRILNPQYRQDLIPGHVRPYPLALPHIQVYNYIAQEDSIVNHDAEKYKRRDVVEPASPGSGNDRNGEYVTENVTKYHKVKKGETIASIAKKYGVSVSSIQRANGLGKRKSVKRGQTLKIVTTRRVYKPAAKDETACPELTSDEQQSAQAVESVESVDESTAVEPAVEAVDEKSPATPSSKVTGAMNTAKDKKNSAAEKKNDSKSKKQNDKSGKTAPKTTTHKVQTGENLWKIANKYGVTVDDIRAANGMKNDNIAVGQTLKIPAKAAPAKSPAKKSSGKKSKKRRR